MTLFTITNQISSENDAEEETTEEKVQVSQESASTFGSMFLEATKKTNDDEKKSEKKTKNKFSLTEDAFATNALESDEEEEVSEEDVTSSPLNIQSAVDQAIEEELSSSAAPGARIRQNKIRSLSKENEEFTGKKANIIAILYKNITRKGYIKNNVLFIEKFKSEKFNPMRYIIFRKSLFSERDFKPIATIDAKQASLDDEHKDFIENKFSDVKIENLFSFVDNNIYQDAVYAYRIETHYKVKNNEFDEEAFAANAFTTPSTFEL